MFANFISRIGFGCFLVLIYGCGSEANSSSEEFPSSEQSPSKSIDHSGAMKIEDDTNDSIESIPTSPKNSESVLQESKADSSLEITKIQEILTRANPEYRGQGKFHQENGLIVAAEFPACGLRDLSPLRGLDLMALDLSGNPVREIRHLKGMPLRTLFLENTKVESLRDLKDARLVELRLNNSPVSSLQGLEGQPLENLYAVGTRITEVSALNASNLNQLWLSESPVSDVSGLKGLPLVSLTLYRTFVSDLSFVRKLPVLQRLHIGDTLIEDLTPLDGLNLTRLVFSPDRIKKGLNIVRNLHGLREIGTAFDDQRRDLTSPELFWQNF